MFDFEKLDVYQVVREQVISVLKYIYVHPDLDIYIRDQWKRASMSILQNLAEGTGRMTNDDKKHYLTTARGSVFESVAILDALVGMEMLDKEDYQSFYNGYEKISKMLLGMYRSYDK